MTELSKTKIEVVNSVESQRDELFKLSRDIHGNPELGFNEVKASAWLCEYLQKHGFDVQKKIADLDTAFKATYGRGKPEIAVLAEYDALPDIGHACGHNIIAAAAAGAGVASKCTVDKYGGTVMVIGTPAEELNGGKIALVDAGVFKEIDVALLIHPGSRNVATVEALACIGLNVEYFGKMAHAAAHPEEGVNALEALILAFNAINSLRQHTMRGARIHGIITHGGDAANVVPAYAAAKFLIRALDMKSLDELKEKALKCFQGAAIATGCELIYGWADSVYADMYNNMTLANLMAANLSSLGREVESLDQDYSFGSTDMGNVSQVVPAIHPAIAIADDDTHTHSVEFALAAISESGNKGLVDGAKAMAMTVVDLLAERANLKAVKDEFNTKKK